MPAFLRVLACSPTVSVEPLDEHARARLSDGFLIGITPMCHLYVRGTHIGGRQNCRFHCDANGRWWIQHQGHTRSIHVAGEQLDTRARELVHGDTIDLETNPGLELRFVFELE